MDGVAVAVGADGDETATNGAVRRQTDTLPMEVTWQTYRHTSSHCRGVDDYEGDDDDGGDQAYSDVKVRTTGAYRTDDDHRTIGNQDGEQTGDNQKYADDPQQQHTIRRCRGHDILVDDEAVDTKSREGDEVHDCRFSKVQHGIYKYIDLVKIDITGDCQKSKRKNNLKICTFKNIQHKTSGTIYDKDFFHKLGRTVYHAICVYVIRINIAV